MPTTIGLELRLLVDQDELDLYIAAAVREGKTLTRWLKDRLLGSASPEALVAAPTPPAEDWNAEPTAAPAKQKKERKKPEPAKGDIPRGKNAILAAAERLAKGRAQVLREHRLEKPYGARYTRGMRAWYAANGFADMDQAIRSTLGLIGNELELIRQWTNSQQIPDTLGPAGLLYRWNHRQKGTPPRPKPAEPKLRKTAPPPAPVDTTRTLAYRGGKLGMHPVDEVVRPASGKAADPADAPPPLAGSYASFADVDLSRLPHDNPYDARVLRRFTEKLLAAGKVTEEVDSSKLASAVNAIKGKESGDTPTCAHRLSAMGVLWGTSGSYKIRPEYVRRLNDLENWLT